MPPPQIYLLLGSGAVWPDSVLPGKQDGAQGAECGEAEQADDGSGESAEDEGDPANGALTLATRRLVVTREVLRPGDVVESGSLIAEVSGRPVFALSASVPLYRDLAVGATGADVEELQRTLAAWGYFDAEATGYFGPVTLAALSGFYRDAGYSLRTIGQGQEGLSIDEFVAVPDGILYVARVAARGSVLDAESPLARADVGMATIVGRVDALEVGGLSVGTEVEVAQPGRDAARVAVSAISGYVEGGDGPPGYDVTVDVPESWDSGAADGPIVVRQVDDIPLRLAIPLAAVRQDSAGTFVLLACAAGDREPPRIQISIIRQVGGYVILDSSDGLPVNPKILVGAKTCQ